ncbi:MAG: YveK family protein [Facklamia hominis]
MEEEISLLDLWKLFLKHFKTIFFTTLLAIIVSVVVTKVFITPQYKSKAELIVNQESNSSQTIQYNDLQTSINLINTYKDIIQSESLLTEVSQKMGGQVTAEVLSESIDVQQSQNSQAFEVSATLPDPKLAQEVVDNVVTSFQETLKGIYGDKISNIYLLSSANYNPVAVSPRTILSALIGMVLGGALSLLVVIVQELSDTTVKNEDFLNGLGMIKLGEVYSISKEDRKKARKHGQKKANRRRG